jgi:hypothetical protein
MDIPSYFSVPFIQAVNDWQFDPTPANAQRLALLSTQIPVEFKNRRSHVYRRIDLPAHHMWQLLAEERLPEKISSWSESELVAKNHGGIPEKYQAVLLRIPPERGRTIINISRLFGPNGFRLACLMLEEQLIDYEFGIGAFDNSEQEVVVKVDHITPDDIVGFFGPSSSEAELIYLAGKEEYGRLPNADEQAALLTRMRWSGRRVGFQWLSEDGVLNVRSRMRERIFELKRIKQLQNKAKLGSELL